MANNEMTDTEHPTRVVMATVAEASREVHYDRNGMESAAWALRLSIPEISDYPLPMQMAGDGAGEIIKGSVHRVRIKRGRLKQNKTGERDYDYWWDLVEWDTGAPLPEREADSAGNSRASQDGYRRSVEVMNWIAALEIAARRTAQGSVDELAAEAGAIYALIVAGPPESDSKTQPDGDEDDSKRPLDDARSEDDDSHPAPPGRFKRHPAAAVEGYNAQGEPYHYLGASRNRCFCGWDWEGTDGPS